MVGVAVGDTPESILVQDSGVPGAVRDVRLVGVFVPVAIVLNMVSGRGRGGVVGGGWSVRVECVDEGKYLVFGQLPVVLV